MASVEVQIILSYFNTRDNNQLQALTSIAKSLESAQARYVLQHSSALVALVPTAPSRKLDSMFLHLLQEGVNLLLSDDYIINLYKCFVCSTTRPIHN